MILRYAAAKDTLLASMLIMDDPQPMLRLITVLQTMEQADLCIDIIDLFKKKSGSKTFTCYRFIISDFLIVSMNWVMWKNLFVLYSLTTEEITI